MKTNEGLYRENTKNTKMQTINIYNYQLKKKTIKINIFISFSKTKKVK